MFKVSSGLINNCKKKRFLCGHVKFTKAEDIFLLSRVGSITAEDIISFTVSNYDALDTADNGEDNVWNARSAKKNIDKM